MSVRGEILGEILAAKAAEVESRARAVPLAELRARVKELPRARGFVSALEKKIAGGEAAVIAEMKRKSPSRGVLREHFDPAEIARDYEANGAACLSVLTDAKFFGGDGEHLRMARGACALPALRKDFVIDAYQVYEARMLGADAVLLIAAALGEPALHALTELAHALGMDALVEVHDESELTRACNAPGKLIGINNRNLRTFETRLEVTLNLLDAIPPGKIVVTESGLHTRDDVLRMRARGVHAFLVGEAFMRAESPGEKLRGMFAQ